MINNKEVFQYSYSAEKREEIENIRKRYQQEESEEEAKMKELRELDRKVQCAGTIPSILLGVIGTLILGTGMSCVLVWGSQLLFPGIVFGIIGMAGIALAYPLSRLLHEKRKKELTPEILKLSEELMLLF